MRIKVSYLIAAGLTLALGGWLVSGQIGAEDQTPAAEENRAAAAPEAQLPAVQVREVKASPTRREIQVNGKTAPVRSVQLRAETGGRVVEIGARRGALVSTGDLLLRVDARERHALVDQARAMLDMRRIELDAANELGAKGYQAETQVAGAKANFSAAEAALEQARIDLDHTEIRAPFDGVLELRPVEIGDFVDIGDPVATLIDQDPFLVVGDVTEREVGQIEAGMKGEADLVTGETVQGTIRYVAAQADEATRTFRVELEVPNPGGRLTAGVSAGLKIAAEEVMAHQVSPALLSLDDAGRIGVKAVDGNDMVVFHPVEIVLSDAQSIWLTGLPETATLITVGQGFVRHGTKVRPVAETVPAAALVSEAGS